MRIRDSVIFDFDGTVCETAPGVVKSAKYALESFGYPVPEDEHEPVSYTHLDVYKRQVKGRKRLRMDRAAQ